MFAQGFLSPDHFWSLTLLFLQFFFMSAINLLSLMRKHEFPWEESKLVVSHVNGTGPCVGCEGLEGPHGSPQAQTPPVGWMCVEVMTGDHDAAGF